MPDQRWILDTISALNSEGSPASIDEALEQLAQKLQLDRIVLRYRDQGRDAFRVVAEYHGEGLIPIDTLEPEMDSAASLALVQQLLRDGWVKIEDIEVTPGFSDEEIRRARDWGCRAFLFLPLRYQNAINGMIIAIKSYQPRSWDDSDQFAVQLIGETALSIWLRHNSLKALYDSRQRYRWAVEASNDALFDWDIHGDIISHSPRFFQILGRPFIEKMSMDDLLSIVHPDDIELLTEKIRAAMNGELLRTQFELRMLNGYGEVVWLMISAAMVEFDEEQKPTRGFGTLSDITTFKKTLQHLELLRQNAEKANMAKSEFLARMSHEVRTPLNAITGMLHLLQDTRLDEGQREKLEAMQGASGQLLSVLNDILDISRIESGRLELERIPFDLDELIQQSIHMYSARAHEKQVDLIVSLDCGLSTRVIGDPNRLLQILGNLLSNALKFTDHGEVVLKLHCREVTDKQVAFECEVGDTGVGMTQEQLDRLFNPFVQAEQNIARQYGGSGLGLSICKSLVELMGGHILARSTPGVGSQFLFTLQLERDSAGELPHESLVMDNHGTDLVLCRNQSALKAYEGLFTLLGMDNHVAADTATTELFSQSLGKLPHSGRVWIDAKFDEQELELLQRFLQEADSRPEIILLPLVLTESLRSFLADWPSLQYLPKPLTPGKLRRFLNPGQAGEKAAVPFNLSEKDRQRLAGMRVLLVEDNKINQMVAREMLAKYGMDVFVCEHGKEAVDEIYYKPQGYYQLVLMDLEMPVMDGFQATRQIRQMEKARDLPIIAMTANTLSADVQRCRQAGMFSHIGKPIDPQVLISNILKLPS